MSEKNLVLLVTGHQGYIRNSRKEKSFDLENDILFTSISETYLPLLNLFHRLEEEQVCFKISVVLSPALCSLLADPLIQEQYVEWLDKRIAFGEKEVNRLKNDVSKSDFYKAAQKLYRKACDNRSAFVEKYSCNILKEFSEFQKKGFVELLATCGTYAFLPHYNDMPEVLNAQIETGLYSHRHYFGVNADGFWIPFMGYTPGIEKTLRSYGLNYTIIDTASMLFGKKVPENGIFFPSRFESANLAVFAQDADSPDDVLKFSENVIYRNQARDAGFEFDYDNLKEFLGDSTTRCPTGYKYWSKISENSVYDEEKANEQVKNDARTFLNSKYEKLAVASDCMNDKNPCLLCVFDARTLGQDWAEGVDFIENVFRLNDKSDLKFKTFSNVLENQFKLEKIQPSPLIAQESNYGEDQLDSTNGWMLRYTKKMCQRMVDLADRFPLDTGLKIRLLNLGASELLLAQSGEWAKMIHDGILPDFAEQRFKDSIKAFMIIYDALGSNTVNTEWLTKVERDDAIFPWMNFRVFCPKK